MHTFIHYFRFYYRITGWRFLAIMVLALAGTVGHAVMCAALYAVLNFTTPPAEQNLLARIIFGILDGVGLETSAYRLGMLLAAAVGAAALSGLIFLYEEYYVASLRADLAVRLQSQALGSLLDCRYEHILTRNAGDINNIIISQIRNVAQSMRFFSAVITQTCLAALYLAMPFALDYTVALGMMAVYLPLIPVIRFLNRRIQDFSVRTVKALGHVNELMLQTIGNIKYLKATATYPVMIRRFTRRNREYARMTRNLAVWGSLGAQGLPPFAIAMISALIFWKIFYGGENPMDALLILGILYAAAQKAITIPTSYQKFVATIGSLAIYEQFEQEVQANREPQATPMTAPDLSDDLILHGVTFRYASTREPVLRDLSLVIPARSCVAFVGGSGAGKSTVVNLLTGLLRPTNGTIRLGETDYRDLDMAALRRGIGYVTQEAVVFGDTVRANLAMWRDDLDDEAIRTAARRAHADAFIAEMPQGYDTILGDHGFTISGGQRQRLAIAREILRGTPILILDEATSALDSATERLIQDSIREFQGNKTLILIAHRLSTIRHADKIFVLEQGELAESGTYDELCQAGGRFRHMVDQQGLE
jgi:ABC-type multidrug transport system fused ATPase/permease subunit